MGQRIVLLHVNAPQKPAPGAACNGCGVCCATEPCPLGMLASRRRHGRCAMLRFDAQQSRYSCGAVHQALYRWPSLPLALRPLLARLVKRWIGAGRGCDSSLLAAPVQVRLAQAPRQTAPRFSTRPQG